MAPCGPGATHRLLIPSLPHLLLYLLVSLTLLFPFLTRFIYFRRVSIPFHSTRIIPLHFQAGCRRRRLNLALVFFVDLCCVYFSEGCTLLFVVFDLV